MVVLENSKFSEHLYGKDGLESVSKLIQAEIKLLEQMETYVEKRASLDMEYAEKLGKLHKNVKFCEANQYTNGSLIDKAWRTYMTESENKAITILQTSKQLNSQTIPRIRTLISRKKDANENFNKNKQKMEIEFGRSVDEKDRLENIYKTALRDCGKAKKSLDESYHKAKGPKEWPKLKEKFDLASRKLHMNHNEYLLSIEALNEHDTYKQKEIIPHLLNSIEDVEKRFLIPWKELFLELVLNSSWCREEFITSERELNQSVEFISEDREFIGFLTSHGKEQTPFLPCMFDDTLTKDQNSTSGLSSDKLAVNDLTHEQLLSKQQTFEGDKVVHNKNIELKKSEVEEIEKTLREMSSGDSSTIFSLIEQCQLWNEASLQLKELECKNTITQVQYDILDGALKEALNPSKPYIDLNPPGPAPSSNGSGSSNDLSHKHESGTFTLPDIQKRPLPGLPPEHKGHNTLMGKINKLRTSSKAGELKNGKRTTVTGPSPQIAPKPVRLKAKKEEQHDSDSFVSTDSNESYEEPDEGEASIQACSWFHGRIDRATVARFLKVDGDFIVREKSDGSGGYVLSVLWRGHTKHFILKPDIEGNYKLEAEQFDNIPALINHHHENAIVVQSSNGVVLVNPIRRIFIEGDGYVTRRDDIRLDQRLGAGHFGEVYRGHLKSKNLPIAVKVCKPNDDQANQKQKFMEEAEIMKDCDHRNIVKLIGIVRENDPYYIILELCEKGDLLQLLRKEKVRLTPKNFMQMAIDVVSGMAYLESKQIIHRDLAARNCLVKLDYTVKVCDFGMSREEDEEGHYSIKQTKEIPYKWCAPEIWHYNTYSVKTDVWSYGIVLWEIFSMGQTPYVGWSNRDTKLQVDQGHRLDQPSGTPSEIYTIMRNCWDVNPDVRNSFAEIQEQLMILKDHLFLQ